TSHRVAATPPLPFQARAPERHEPRVHRVEEPPEPGEEKEAAVEAADGERIEPAGDGHDATTVTTQRPSRRDVRQISGGWAWCLRAAIWVGNGTVRPPCS